MGAERGTAKARKFYIMVIFENPDTGKRAIFTHLQHTGGSSTKKWLEQNYRIVYEPGDGVVTDSMVDRSGYWHKPLCLAQNYEIQMCFKFGFIRNPFDWYVSYWHRRGEERQSWSFKHFMSLPVSEQLPYAYGNTRVVFESFKRIPQNIGMLTWRFLTAYFDLAKIVIDPNWRSRWRELCLADAIAPMELGHIGILRQLLTDTLGFKNDTEFPHENSTERKPWQEYYDDAMVREVVWRDRLIFKAFPMYMDMLR